jgi:hypothetical protein
VERRGERLPAAPGPLLWEDALETEANSSALVHLKGGETLEVGPLTRFLFSREAGNVVVRLERGVILSRTTEGAPAGVAPAQPELKILTREGIVRSMGALTEMVIRVSLDQARFEVRVGSAVLISRRGERTSLGPDSRVTLKDGTLVPEPTVAAPPHLPPTATSPPAAPLPPRSPVELFSRPAQRVYHPAREQVTLSWPERGGPYRVEVAPAASFHTVISSEWVFEPFINVGAPAEGRLFWRVFLKGAQSPFARGSAVFGPEPPPHAQPFVHNELREGADTAVYFQGQPPSLAFRFQPEPRATSYRLLIYREGQLDHPLVERTYSKERASIDAGLLAEGSYFWSVVPLASGDQPLSGGRLTKLRILYDNSEPLLLVSTPKNGHPASGQVRVQGVAPVGTDVWLNGSALVLDAQHRFDAVVTPRGAPPVLAFRWQRRGADVTTVRVLKSGADDAQGLRPVP